MFCDLYSQCQHCQSVIRCDHQLLKSVSVVYTMNVVYTCSMFLFVSVLLVVYCWFAPCISVSVCQCCSLLFVSVYQCCNMLLVSVYHCSFSSVLAWLPSLLSSCASLHVYSCSTEIPGITPPCSPMSGRRTRPDNVFSRLTCQVNPSSPHPSR